MPDDDLLRGVLVKLFADRQIAVDEPIVSYLMVPHAARSGGGARYLVAEIDRRALEEKAEVTRHFVAQVLAGHLGARDCLRDRRGAEKAFIVRSSWPYYER